MGMGRVAGGRGRLSYLSFANRVSFTTDPEEPSMSFATIEEAQTQLPELVDHLTAGEEVVITRDGKPVARLVLPELPKGYPIFGRGIGKLVIHSEEDEDFSEYVS